MKRLIALFFGGWLMATVGQNAYAATDTVAGLMAEMKSLSNEVNGFKAKKAEKLRLNITPKKKTALWMEQLKTRIYPKVAVVKIHIAELKAKKAKYTDIIRESNKGCTGPAKNQEHYDRCVRAKQYHDTLRADFARHHARVEKERVAVVKEELSYVTLIRKNNAQIQRNEQQAAALQARINNNMATLNRYRRQLVADCARADAALRNRTADMSRVNEALRHCHSINWDGARRTLPPLDTILRGSQFFGR